jgi:hypothetical protein
MRIFVRKHHQERILKVESRCSIPPSSFTTSASVSFLLIMPMTGREGRKGRYKPDGGRKQGPWIFIYVYGQNNWIFIYVYRQNNFSMPNIHSNSVVDPDLHHFETWIRCK